MQATRMSTPRARSRQRSCNECRRRRQKCNPRRDGPCGNCSRRYPPVECIMPERAEYVIHEPRIETEITFSAPHIGATESNSKSKSNPLPSREQPYVSPYSIVPANEPPREPSKRKSNRMVEHESFSASSLSTPASIFTDRDCYFDLPLSPKDGLTVDFSPDAWLKAVEDGNTVSGSPKVFGGVLAAISSLNSFPIQLTIRNVELFHLFHQFVVPNLVAIDGAGEVPALFLQEMLPWMVQSPLMPNIAILMASYTQSLDQNCQVLMQSEPLRIKAHVLSLINQFLKGDFRVVGGEALRAVIHLVILEWFWGAEGSLWAHMKGIKQMIKLSGGLEGMQDFLLAQVLILTDYELACCFERQLYLQPPPTEEDDLRIPDTYPEHFSSPLLDFPTTFQKAEVNLDLNSPTAQILDNMRTLTLLITSESATRIDTIKIQIAAERFYHGIQSNILKERDSSNDDYVLETIRLAALVYTSCIKSLTNFRSQRNQPLMKKLCSSIMNVSLTRWKQIPGIFLWILLIAAPSSTNNAHGRFLKKKMAVAGMSIGLEDFNLATGQLRAFWKIQRWIARETQNIKEVE